MINDAAHIRTFTRFLNLAENDPQRGVDPADTNYKSIYIYNDGNHKRKQVTLGRGFTQDGGNLWKVLARYIAKGGAKADFFASYQAKMSNGDLWQDKEFLKTIGTCSTEQAMRDAQDEVFNEAYLNPALQWADAHGFKLALSYGVAVDSYLHSGQMTSWLINKFPEHSPANGGDEKKWMQAYLEERLAWFERVSGALHTCTFRPKFFLTQIKSGNWDLVCPMTVPGKGIIS